MSPPPMATQDPAELAANLQEYNEQLAQVQELLAVDPHNSEYLDLQNSLLEVIGLTTDLLAGGSAAQGFSSGPVAAPLTGQLLKTKWTPGEACQGLFTDGLWYTATVQSAAPNGCFRVLFDHYAVPVVLPAQSLRPSTRPAAADGYVGVPAPKRLRLDEEPRAAPKRPIEIKEDDDEATRERKKRLNKLLKSKQRLQEKETEQQARAQSWQNFRAGKAGKHKTGFLTKVNERSMFAVPDGGRIGVTTSGKAPAPIVEKRKHEFRTDEHHDEE